MSHSQITRLNGTYAHPKVELKISGGFRTVEGARIHTRILAVISNFRKRGQNVFASLREIFDSPIPA
uniref:Uncharacterized protein n=1 Tax=Candidatus Kentrum eta TaxID=2126337 RepID=A0A450U8Q5_9GAMM|nr:MAG: hypothetical protein BECKH772A_GA0070896_1000824 [Candidatus Kentron sp. H]